MPIGTPGAEVVGSAWVKLGIDTSAFNTGLEKAHSGLNKFAAAIGVTFAAAAVVKFAKDATTALETLETSTTRLFAEMKDASQATRDAVTKDVERISKSYNLQMAEVTDAVHKAFDIGATEQNLGAFMDVAAKLSKATEKELVPTTVALGKAIQLTGGDFADATSLANAFFAASEAGDTDIEGLGASLGKLIPYTKALGIATTDTIAVFATMAQKGVQTRVAVGGIMAAMEELSGKNKALSAAFERTAGASLPKFIAAGHGLQDVFEVVAEIAKITGKSVNTLFDNVSAGSAVFLTTGEYAAAFAKNLADVQDGASAIDRVWSAMSQTMKEKLAGLEVAWTDIKIAVGQALQPAVEKLADTLQEKMPQIKELLEKAFTALSNGLQWVLDHGEQVAFLLKGIEVVLIALCAAKIITGIATLTTSLKTLSVLLAANPLGVLLLALGATAVGFMNANAANDALNRTTDEAIKKAGTLNNALREGAQDWAVFGKAQEGVNAQLTAFAAAGELTEKEAEQIKRGIGALYDKILSSRYTPEQQLAAWTKGLQTWAKAFDLPALETGFETTLGTIGLVFDSLAKKIGDTAVSVVGSFTAMQDSWSGLFGGQGKDIDIEGGFGVSPEKKPTTTAEGAPSTETEVPAKAAVAFLDQSMSSLLETTQGGITALLDSLKSGTGSIQDEVLGQIDNVDLSVNQILAKFGELTAVASGIQALDQMFNQLGISSGAAYEKFVALKATIVELIPGLLDFGKTLTDQVSGKKLGNLGELLSGGFSDAITSLLTGDLTIGDSLTKFADASGVKDALTNIGMMFQSLGVKSGPAFDTWVADMQLLAAKVPAWKDGIDQFIAEVKGGAASLSASFGKLKLTDLSAIQGQIAESLKTLRDGSQSVETFAAAWGEIGNVRSQLVAIGDAFQQLGVTSGLAFDSWEAEMLSLASQVPAWADAIAAFIAEVKGGTITLSATFGGLQMTNLSGAQADIADALAALRTGAQTVTKFTAQWSEVGNIRSTLLSLGDAFQQLGVTSGTLYDSWEGAMLQMADAVPPWRDEIYKTIDAVQHFGESLDALSTTFGKKSMLDLSQIGPRLEEAITAITSGELTPGVAGSMKLSDFFNIKGEVDKVKSDLLAVGDAFKVYGIKSGPLFDEWITATYVVGAANASFAKEMDAARKSVAGFAAELEKAFLDRSMSAALSTSADYITSILEILSSGIGQVVDTEGNKTIQELSPNQLLEAYGQLTGLVSTVGSLDEMFKALGDSTSTAYLEFVALKKVIETQIPIGVRQMIAEKNLTEQAQKSADAFGQMASSLVGMISALTGEDYSVLGNVLQGGLTAVLGFATGNIVAGFTGMVDVVASIVTGYAKQRAEEEKKKADKYTEAIYGTIRMFQDLNDAIMGAISSLESYQNMQSKLGSFFGKIWDGLFGGLFDAISAIAESLLSILFPAITDSTTAIKKETESRLDNLNVPTGWKVDRIRYEVAVPGQPPIDYSASATDTVESAKTEVVDALKWLKDLLLGMGPVWTNVVDTFKAVISTVGEIWKALAPAVLGAILPIFQTIGDVLLAFVTYIKDNMLEDLKAFFGAFGEFWKTKVDPFLKNDVFPALGAILLKLWGAFEAFFTWFSGTAWNDIVTYLWPILKDVLSMLADEFVSVLGTLQQYWPDIKEFIGWIIQQWGASLKTKLEDFKLSLTKLSGAMDDIAKGKSTFWGNLFKQIGMDIAQGIWDWIWGKGKAAGGPITGSRSGDTVPAMLSPGEFVVPTWMMALPGVGKLIEDTWKTGRFATDAVVEMMPFGMNTPPKGLGAGGYGTPALASSFPIFSGLPATLQPASFAPLGANLGDIVLVTNVEIDGDRVAQAVSRRQARKQLLTSGFELATEY